jgi:hypothetical protein
MTYYLGKVVSAVLLQHWRLSFNMNSRRGIIDLLSHFLDISLGNSWQQFL